MQSASPWGILTRVILSAPRHHYSFEEYLELEEIAGVRHEFFGGEIHAMAGGTPEHAAMAAAVTTILGGQLGSSPSRVYSSDLRVRVVATGLATYPDVTVVCGRSERDSNSKTHVTNPKILVEVLSPATAEYDRGEKLEHYRQIPTLEAVVLIDHEVPKIELWTRDGEGWVERRFSAGQIVPLDPIGCVLAVDEVYVAAPPVCRPELPATLELSRRSIVSVQPDPTNSIRTETTGERRWIESAMLPLFRNGTDRVIEYPNIPQSDQGRLFGRSSLRNLRTSQVEIDPFWASWGLNVHATAILGWSAPLHG